MEWNDSIDLSKRKITSRLIIERALARGWKVRGFESNPAIFLIYVPGKEQPVQIFSTSPPQMSYPAVKITSDKYITNTLLAEAGLPVPKEILVNLKDMPSDAKLQKFIDTHKKVVVKPIDAAHGIGITVGVSSLEMLQEALAVSKASTGNDMVLIQEHVAGIDIRVICINYQFVNSISRSPATIIGDGQHTVRELIDITNSSNDRGDDYKAKFNTIPVVNAEQF